MKRVLISKADDGTEYRFQVKFDETERKQNAKIISEGKKPSWDETATYYKSLDEIFDQIYKKEQEYFTEGAKGTFTPVEIRKYLKSQLNESTGDNINSLPTYPKPKR